MIVALALLLAAPAPAAAGGDEIVVQASRGKCRLVFADRTMGEREFAMRARTWAEGRPVRVIEPRGADYRCLAKIMFRLADHGVTTAEFVDAPEAE